MCILLHTDMTRTIAFLLSSWILLTAVSYARVFDLDFNPAQNETESRNGTNGSSHFQRVTLDAPTTNVGDTIFKGINLTLMSTREHNWLDWEISNRKKISTLTLYGRFGPKDFRFFLSNFTGIHELSVGRGRYLCPQFDLKRNNSEVKSYNNVSTFRVFRITIECKGLYEFLDSEVTFPNLTSVIFNGVFISQANIAAFNNFLMRHSASLKELVFVNVLLCKSCVLFQGFNFPNLTKAVFHFNQHSQSVSETMTHFAWASPIRNLECDSREVCVFSI